MGQLVLSLRGGLGHGCYQGCQCDLRHLCDCFPAAAAGFSNKQKTTKKMLGPPAYWLLLCNVHLSVFTDDIPFHALSSR